MLSNLPFFFCKRKLSTMFLPCNPLINGWKSRWKIKNSDLGNQIFANLSLIISATATINLHTITVCIVEILAALWCDINDPNDNVSLTIIHCLSHISSSFQHSNVGSMILACMKVVTYQRICVITHTDRFDFLHF